MYVKIDTKEIFTVITAEELKITANMADKLFEMLHSYLNQPISNLIFNLQNVGEMDREPAENLVRLQQLFNEHNVSFVLCCMQPSLKLLFSEMGILEKLNHTPTESEAWDIVQMDEIERELLGDESDAPEE